MASELSSFIENELRNKGFAYDAEEDSEAADNPHTSLIGALRVEVRSCEAAAVCAAILRSGAADT